VLILLNCSSLTFAALLFGCNTVNYSGRAGLGDSRFLSMKALFFAILLKASVVFYSPYYWLISFETSATSRAMSWLEATL